MKQQVHTSKSHRVADVVVQLVCIALALCILAPILYALSASFMTSDELLTREYRLLPSRWTLENYQAVFRRTPFLRYMLNSFVIAAVCSVVRVIVAAMSAFAYSFYEFPGKKILFALTLSTMMIPTDVLIVQNFITVSNMGLVNTYPGVCSVFLASANNIFIIRQQFLTYSRSLHEAARLDGASDIGFFTKILLPTNKPVLFTVLISSFVSVWNQYVWPMIITNKTQMRTVQVGITMLKDRESSVFGPVMAGAVIALVPTVIVFVLFLPRIVAGMLSGAVKE